MYYYIKPFIPRYLQILLRRGIALRKRKLCADIWPIDVRAGRAPLGWTGWPDGKQFAFVLTHDVETEKGQDKCRKLVKLEEESGFRSSFNFVPADYPVNPELRDYLVNNGFEVGVHGYTHDGSLYKSRNVFQTHAIHINRYLRDWGAVGFRSPAMHHNLEWLKDLEIEYDASTFDTDPFEPQPDGTCTIFPFWVEDNYAQKGYVELSYTLPQDFTIFVIMKGKNTDVWKEKLAWIADNGGMALLITHPDYMNFGDKKLSIDEYPAEYYKEFLEYTKNTYKGLYWHATPKEVAQYHMQSRMK